MTKNNLMKSLFFLKVATKTQEATQNPSGFHASCPPPRMIIPAQQPVQPVASPEILIQPLSVPVLRPPKKLKNG